MKVINLSRIVCAMCLVGMLMLSGCGSAQPMSGEKTSGFPQTSKTIIVDSAHPPVDGAKVVKVYEDGLYGKTELRDDDYHRHADPASPTGWTPWHYRHAPHNWGDMPAKAAPAPVGMNHTTAYFPTAYTGMDGKSGLATVRLDKYAPGEVAVGQEYDYKIVVTNDSSLKLHDVVVTDMMPANFKVASTDPSIEGIKDGKGVWMLGDLDAGESKTITIKGAATEPGQLVDCSTVTFVPYNCIATNVIKPSLQLTKTEPADVMLCERIPVTYVVTNNGTGTARNVMIKDTLPKGLVTETGDNMVSINVGDLAGGESKRYVVTTKPLDTGAYESKAMAMGDGGLKADATAGTKVHEPVLKLTKTGPEKMFIGKEFTYTIKLENTGDAPADDAVITDMVPAGTTYVGASTGGTMAEGKVTWNVGSIAPKGSKEVTVTVKSATPGTFKDTAMAHAKCAKDVSAEASTMVTGIPAILLEVVDVEDPIQVGNNVTYLITVTNQGSAPGTNIKIVADLEDTMQFVSAEGATAGKAAGKVVTFDPLPSLAPKAQAVFKVVVKAVKEGDVRFKVSMNSDQIGRPVEETEATNFFK
ncbi:MAG: DUF11 domain-containing protein [Planctomycetes bacterium]|nr:DUF11 domain-containing protein [Planctomycetota bacterium]